MARQADSTGAPDAQLVATTRIASPDDCTGALTCGCPRCHHERQQRVQRGAGPDASDDHGREDIAYLMRANRGAC